MSTDPSKLWTLDEVRTVLEFVDVGYERSRAKAYEVMRFIERQRSVAQEVGRRAALAEKAKTQPRDERGHFTKRDLSAA